MRESKYNFIIKGENGNAIFYNTRTGSLAIVKPEIKN